ncbi:MAG: histidinol-phosphate transaminase [Candidatus Omnitrophota bacterium]
MKKIVNKRILEIKPYVPGKPIEEVQRELGLKDVVKLASNENPFGPSPQVLKAISQKAKTINRYPESSCFYLREELSRQLNVKPNQLIFGNGSDEIIVLATRVFTGPGDEVIVARPSFLIYEIAARIAGSKLKFVSLKNFRYDLDAMAKAVTKKTKIIFIGNPDNPAGTYITETELKKFLRKIRKNILVFMDEAYFEFAQGKKGYPDSIKLLESHKNMIVTRTFSKMYGLAGLRVGYGVADSSVIDIFERVREPFNVNSLAQAAAVACLQDKRYYQNILKRLENQRRYLYKSFQRLGLHFVKTATNFVLLDTGQDSLKFSQSLLRKGIIVRDMGFWGLDTFIRITIGSEKENKKLIRALKDLIS